MMFTKNKSQSEKQEWTDPMPVQASQPNPDDAYTDSGSSPPLVTALTYAKRGFSVIPLRPKDKRPLIEWTRFQKQQPSEEEIQSWFAKWPDANVGIVTGKISGLVVLDIDGDNGKKSVQGKPLPLGPITRTGKGEHHYFKHPGPEIPNFTGKLPGIDLRGDGGYVVAPPSIHPSSTTYEWVEGTQEEELPDMPQWLLQLASTDKDKNPGTVDISDRDLMPPERIPEGQRNSRLASIAGTMRRDGLTQKAIEAALLQTNRTQCDPPLPEAEVRRIGQSIAKYPPEPVPAPSSKIIPQVGLKKELADTILQEAYFAQDAGGMLYHYKNGRYQPKGADYVKRQVKSLLEQWNRSKSWNARLADEVVEYIRVDAPMLWESPPLDVLNLKNGLLDLKTNTLHEHSPDHLSSIQLPVSYDPAAECPEWEKFVNDTFPDDAKETPWEMIAWLMIPDTSHQTAIMLVGEGSNGKSRFLAGLIAFLGRRNVSAVSLQKLESDRFAGSRLVGKLANICADLPSTQLEETSLFKTITGGDYVHGERKYKESFEFSPTARLVFSTNQLPRSKDRSSAFFRRWRVIPFEKTFDQDMPGYRSSAEIDRCLSDEKELSGILNKALAVLPKVKEQGITETASMGKAAEKFEKQSNPSTPPIDAIVNWLKSETVLLPNATISKKDLLDSYNACCDRAGRPRASAQAFGRAVRRHYPGISKAQVRSSGQAKWVWKGIGLKDSGQGKKGETA